MRNVYENVELIREQRGITKKKLAENAGISQMSCTRALSGEAKITPEMLKSFANTLGITDMNIFFDEQLTDTVIIKKKDVQSISTY